jgi:hypothetical protein
MAEQRSNRQPKKKSVMTTRRVPTAAEHFERSAPGVGGRATQTAHLQTPPFSPMYVSPVASARSSEGPG